jgi:hypothetical protein
LRTALGGHFHAFINPGDIPLGYAFEATKHTRKTHRMPLPPDCFGSESDNPEILNNIKSFLMGADADESHLPPLYTLPSDIDALKSVL